MPSQSSLRDQPDSFGWISIALHWVTAAIVIAMWIIGKSITSQPSEEIDALRDLHVNLGLSAWVLLAARIVWRFIVRHPHVRGQTRRIHVFARHTHYIMLVVTSVMLLSGPALAWAFAQDAAIATTLLKIHSYSSSLLLALIVLHILGALKHLMFHEDETIVRMIWPRSNPTQSKEIP